jgi:Uma2 family endonuclease
MSESNRDAYSRYRMSDEEFLLWADRPSNVAKRLELFDGSLYELRDDLIAANAHNLSRAFSHAIPPQYSITSQPGRVRCDRHNVLSPDLIVGRGDSNLKPTNIALVVEYERSGGYNRIQAGRRLYLEAGVYSFWHVDLAYRWIEITLRGRSPVLYNSPDDRVPIVLDDVLMKEFALEDLLSSSP